ncbi:MAG: hypothetical protein NVS3B12_19830 [Acidimicrobiales bacterium]
MPLNLSFTHMMVVAFVALVVLGPDRLPGVARTAGNLYREWKRVSGGLQAEVRDVLSEFTEPFTEPISDLLHGPADGGPVSVAEATVVAAGATAAAAAGSPHAVGGPSLATPSAAAPPLTSLPPLPGRADVALGSAVRSGSSGGGQGTGVPDVGPLSPAIPALGPSTGLVSAGPTFAPILSELAPPPEPGTFVPFTPGAAGGHG